MTQVVFKVIHESRENTGFLSEKECEMELTIIGITQYT